MNVTDKAVQRLFKLSNAVELLWENAAPTSGFGKQAIPISNLQEYTNVGVIGTYNQVTNSPDCSITCNTAVGNSAKLQSALGAMQYRSFTIGIDQIQFESGRYLETYRGDGKETLNACVPLIIYGVKLLGGYASKLRSWLHHLLS